MKIQKDCIACIENQAQRVCDNLRVDEIAQNDIKNIAKKHIENFDLELTPPHNATALYQDIAKYLGVEDLYAKEKSDASLRAKEFIPFCESIIANSSNKLLSATKTAVAGNVIDLAAVMMYDLQEELEKIYHMDFAIDDFKELEDRLGSSKTLVYLADNAGEEIFDKIYIQVLHQLFPKMDVFYFVRGKPIINDLTCKDALSSKMDEVATIVNSGVPTPGLALELMSQEASDIFYKADCIISKGMGNYECLGEDNPFPIFFLLKIKCQVVANTIGGQLGDIVCKKGFIS
ncbi:MAG: ARMT1-like domain-containing protein [Sulfurospirillaceae bacterium]|nr:ARMT1-like domain-containing protein [Sulfurospirillaceae bacterium]